MQHKLVSKIHDYLSSITSGNAEVNTEALAEFGERVKQNVLRQFEPQREFKLRMSNIGKPLRQLMLEQKYGRVPPSPDFVLKMLFGDLYEALMLFLLKSAGVNIVEQDKEVSLHISEANLDLKGTLDVIIELDGTRKIYDFKSASPYSYNNKMEYSSLVSNDDFGYVDQLAGYSLASGIPMGGWIVIDKSSGKIKVAEIPQSEQEKILEASLSAITNKVVYITNGYDLPECKGVEDETWYGKSTGNQVLNSSCTFCAYKTKCHASCEYRPSLVSTAKNPKWEYYVHIDKKYKK